VVINGKSCVLALPRDNITFHLMFIKPFNVLNVKIKVNLLELECNNQGIKSKDIIVINISFIIPLKRDKGYPRKYVNIIIFL
jgi:hypothetical protein